MTQSTHVIKNAEGLHARPAGVFVKMAQGFRSQIEIEAAGRRISGKSILNLMSLGLRSGDSLTVIASGEDEAAAVATLGRLIDHQFQA